MSVECMGFEAINLEAWGQRLTAPLNGGRYPMSATFELTNRCNNNCVHCFINEPANDQAAKEHELKTSEIKGIIDQMVDAGVLFLTLTGGEPLLRPDFTEIYTYARRKGMLVGLFTNGTLITEKIADMLNDIRPLMVEITLYGATEKTYEAVTRLPGSYQRCLNGIKLIHERGIPLTLKSEVITLNRVELEEMRAMAEALGVKFRYDGLLWPRLDGRRSPLNYQLSIGELIAMDNADSERREAFGKEVERLKGLTTRDERVFSCGAGINNFHVDSAGRVSICMMTRRPSFNLLEMSLSDAWKALGELRQKQRVLPSPCLSCTINSICSQCPGWSQAMYGDDESVVDFVCELGHLRSENALRIYLNHEIEEEIR